MLRDLGVASGEPVGFFLVLFLQTYHGDLAGSGEGATAHLRKGCWKRALTCHPRRVGTLGGDRLRQWVTYPQSPSTTRVSDSSSITVQQFCFFFERACT